MNRIPQESLAWRNQSRYDNGYDCELPDGVRQELAGNRRDRPKPGKAHPPTTQRSFGGWLAISAACLGLAALLTAIPNRKPVTPAPDLVLEHSKATIAQQQATPSPAAPGPTTSRPAPSASVPRVPRAVLVKLPPPRTQLVRFPEWRVGETRPVMMPYNIEALAKLRGRLDAEWMLPSSGNYIGDTWVVGDTPWLWLAAPGATHADWIDP
jgi:hypothetical protein